MCSCNLDISARRLPDLVRNNVCRVPIQIQQAFSGTNVEWTATKLTKRSTNSKYYIL